MSFQRRMRRAVMVAVTVAMLAAILSLVLGFLGHPAAMASLTGVVIIALVVAGLLAVRPSASDASRAKGH